MRSEPVDARKFVPELVEMYEAYLGGAVDDILEEKVGDVAATTVTLIVPERTVPDSKHGRTTHEAILLVRRADPAPEVAPRHQGEVAYFRAAGMVVNYQSQKNVAAAAVPFHACVLAGEAVPDGGVERKQAERFLRTAEPPAHNIWKQTEGVEVLPRGVHVARTVPLRGPAQTRGSGTPGHDR